MHSDDMNKFDLEMRSLLHDAEVKAPRRVWRAVSSSLDASSSQWWRWAGLAVVAAGVAAAIVLRPAGVTPETDLSNVVAENVANGDVVSQSSDIECVDASCVAPVRTLAAAAPVVVAAPVALPVVDDSTPAQQSASEVASSEAVVSESSQDAAPAASEAISGDTKSDDYATRAAWARIEREEAVKVRKSPLKRASLYAQGAISGSETSFRISPAAVAKMSPNLVGQFAQGIQETSVSTYGVPFSLGLGARVYVLPRLSLGTGVNYSLLTRTFSGTYTDKSSATIYGDIYHSLQYVGVPLNIYYDILGQDKPLKLYIYTGGQAEFCVGNKYEILNAPTSKSVNENVDNAQISTALGLGVEYKISDRLGLYFDPALRYYYHCAQPKNIHTDKPVMLSFEAGLRFNL